MTDLLAGLSRENRIVAATEATRLLALLPSGRLSNKALALLPVYLPVKGAEGAAPLRKGKYPLASMLLARPLPDRQRREEIDLLRAWSLSGALRFCAQFHETDRHSRVANGLRVIRRIVLALYRPDPLADLRSFPHHLVGALLALDRLIEAYRLRNLDLGVQLGQLRLLLSDAATPRAPRFVLGMERAAQELVTRPAQERIEQGTCVTYETAEPLAPDAPPEEEAEVMRASLYDFGRSVLPLIEARAEAQMALIELEDREHVWAGEFAALTQAEMRGLYRAARADPRAGLVAAALVTGRNVADLAALAGEPALGATWLGADGALSFAPDVTRAGPAEITGFALELPHGLQGTEAEARAWLKAQKLERGTHMARIARALPDAFARQREDAAIAALLSGKACAEHIPLYYSSFTFNRLEAAYHSVLRAQFGVIDAERYRIRPLTAGLTRVGSVLCPSLKSVARYFARLIRQVELARAAQDKSLWALVDLVTAETNLAASVLCFQTARRPVREAFEPLSQITGRHRLRVRLTGKGGRQVDDGRIVPLPAASRAALALHMGSLARIEASGLPHAHSALRERLAALRAGLVPLFFAWPALDQVPHDLSAQDLFERVGAPDLPKNRGQRLGSEGAAPANWPRHFLRSALTERGVAGTLIDAFMGHGGASADPLAQVSAAALADHDILCEALDAIWRDLGVTLPEPFA